MGKKVGLFDLGSYELVDEFVGESDCDVGDNGDDQGGDDDRQVR